MNGKILASVNGKPITDADVDAFLAGLGQAGQNYQNPQGRAIILEELISRALFLADAKKSMLEYEEGFKQELAIAKEKLLTGYAIDKALSKVTVTEEELKKYYDENQDKLSAPETVSASHILVEEEDIAKLLLEKIQSGALSFEEAAKQNSACPSGQNGGSLGEFSRGQMVPEFDEACFTMEVGELRGPIKTQFGYHIIRLDGKKEASTLPFADVKEELRQRLFAEKQQAAYRSRVNQLKILFPVEKY